MGNCCDARLSRHEADLAVVERLLADPDALDAGRTTLLIWKCRRDPRLVALAARWLEAQADVRRAFDGVEFYLPQLAHLLARRQSGPCLRHFKRRCHQTQKSSNDGFSPLRESLDGRCTWTWTGPRGRSNGSR